MLTANEITADDRKVKFVTLKAYARGAGGTSLRRDLFSEGEEGVSIENVVLLESLVAKKLEETATSLRQEALEMNRNPHRLRFRRVRFDCERRYPPFSTPAAAFFCRREGVPPSGLQTRGIAVRVILSVHRAPLSFSLSGAIS